MNEMTRRRQVRDIRKYLAEAQRPSAGLFGDALATTGIKRTLMKVGDEDKVKEVLDRHNRFTPVSGADTRFRANYLVNAARRQVDAKTEQRYFTQHVQADYDRIFSRMRLEAAANSYGPVVGWYAKEDDRVTPECAYSDGKNFDYRNPPPWGVPGIGTHHGCRCVPGPPHEGGQLMGPTTEGVAHEHANKPMRVVDMKFNSSQPRWPKGSGPKSGEWRGVGGGTWKANIAGRGGSSSGSSGRRLGGSGRRLGAPRNPVDEAARKTGGTAPTPPRVVDKPKPVAKTPGPPRNRDAEVARERQRIRDEMERRKEDMRRKAAEQEAAAQAEKARRQAEAEEGNRRRRAEIERKRAEAEAKRRQKPEVIGEDELPRYPGKPKYSPEARRKANEEFERKKAAVEEAARKSREENERIRKEAEERLDAKKRARERAEAQRLDRGTDDAIRAAQRRSGKLSGRKRDVSEAVDSQRFSDPETRREADAALEAIDKVHTDGLLPRLKNRSEDTSKSKEKGLQGYYNPNNDDLVVGTTADRKASTMVHELGHFLDNRAMGGMTMGGHADWLAGDIRRWQQENRGRSMDSYVPSASAPKGTAELHKVLMTSIYSKGIIRGAQLAKMYDDWMDEQGADPNRQRHLDYWVSFREIWARSYAQWIAEKSQHPTLMKQLRDQQTEEVRAKAANKMHLANVWQTDDFRPISKAMDDYFASQGWLK